MKLDYLIDTNILILLFNSKLAEPIPNGKLGYSVITEIELLSFSRLTKDEENAIKESLKLLERLTLTAEIAQKTILLRRKYNLKTPDAIIAATAWQHGATLLSNDLQLTRIEEIQVSSLKTEQ
ncbi:MAG: type II toxin-antitoxin system VapC family toxin [Cyanobacteria bacterium P01_A01_bin.83]